ncbi:MAG: amidohydrolase family protein, partial [Planctomycetota bacterium]|nr:amidohydrolase family protein [Planctomycetota bacterium]
QEFIAAPSGMIGMESAVGVLLDRLVRTGRLPLGRMIEAMSCNPARILGLDGGALKPGSRADVTILDLELEWTVDPEKFKSRSRNCPFAGWKVVGAPVFTIVGGRIYEAIGRTCGRE